MSRDRSLRLMVVDQDGARHSLEVLHTSATTIAQLCDKTVQYFGIVDDPSGWSLYDPLLRLWLRPGATLIDLQLRDGQVLHLLRRPAALASLSAYSPELSKLDTFRLVHETGAQIGLAWPIRSDFGESQGLGFVLDEFSGVVRPADSSELAALRIASSRGAFDNDSEASFVVTLDAPGHLLRVNGRRIAELTAEVFVGSLIRIVDEKDESIEVVELRLIGASEHEQIRPRGSTVPYRVRRTGVPEIEVDTQPIVLRAPNHQPMQKFDWWELVLQDGSMLLLYLVLVLFTQFGAYSYILLGMAVARIAYRVVKYVRSRDERIAEEQLATREFDREIGVIGERVRQEVAAVYRRNPGVEELMASASRRGRELWSRQADSSSFLRLQVCRGLYTTRTAVRVEGSRTDFALDQWRKDAQHMRHLADSPLEFDFKTGSLGIVGSAAEAAGVASELVMRMMLLHSPGYLSLAALLPTDVVERRRFEWLRWLPQARSVTDLFVGPRFVHDPARVREAVRESAELASESKRTDDFLLLVVHEASGVDIAALRDYMEAASGRICVLWVGNSPLRVPSLVSQTIELEGGANVDEWISARLSPSNSFVRCRLLPDYDFEMAAATIAPLTDEASFGASAAIPPLVSITSVASVPVTEMGWESSATSALAALGATASSEPFVIDLVEHGPHLLIAGTTGSGKSELLRSMILSLATRYRPTDLSFLLIDFKGGASLSEFERLPHCIGSVSNLEIHEVGRIVDFLNAEILRRQAILRQYNGEYSAYRRSRSGLPRLVVVIDEFGGFMAEGATRRSDAILNIAARGRSLGVHLVLATQTPKGVVTAQVRANVNARISLRTLDQDDSRQVLDSDKAAYIQQAVRGRAYARTDATSLVEFQSALTLGYSRLRADGGSAVTVGDFHRVNQVLQGNSIEPSDTSGSKQDSAVLVDELLELGLDRPSQRRDEGQPRLGRSLWQRDSRLNLTTIRRPSTRAVLCVGLRDEPQLQRQTPGFLDLSEGGILIGGGVRSGRTCALAALGRQFIDWGKGGEVVVVDGGGGDLNQAMPDATWSVSGTDSPSLWLLEQQLAQEYRPSGEMAEILVLIDRLDSVQDGIHNLTRFARLVAGGGRNRLYFAATADPRISVDRDVRRAFRTYIEFDGDRPGVGVDDKGAVIEIADAPPATPPLIAETHGAKEAVRSFGLVGGDAFPVERNANSGWRPVGPINQEQFETATSSYQLPGVILGIDRVRHEAIQLSVVPSLGIAGNARSGRTTALITLGIRLAKRLEDTAPDAYGGVYILAPYEIPRVSDLPIRSFDQLLSDVCSNLMRGEGRRPSDPEALVDAIRTHPIANSSSPIVVLIDGAESYPEMFTQLRKTVGTPTPWDWGSRVLEELVNRQACALIATMNIRALPEGRDLPSLLRETVPIHFRGQHFVVFQPPPRHLLESTSLNSGVSAQLVANDSGYLYRPGEGAAVLRGVRRELLVTPEPMAVEFAATLARQLGRRGGGL